MLPCREKPTDVVVTTPSGRIVVEPFAVIMDEAMRHGMTARRGTGCSPGVDVPFIAETWIQRG